MKVAVITAKAPWGVGETYVLDEVRSLARLGVEVVLTPRSPGRRLSHRLDGDLIRRAIKEPFLSVRVIWGALAIAFRRPKAVLGLLRTMRNESGGWKQYLKNLAVLPKGLYVSLVFAREGVQHIHAHWASTTATMAYVASSMTGIPWSMTAHRFDIAQANMLRLKLESASFVRAISRRGADQLVARAGHGVAQKIHVIHMGTRLGRSNQMHDRSCPLLLSAGHLQEVKGHRYLVEACGILRRQGYEFRLVLAGDGPLRRSLERLVDQLALTDRVALVGHLPHEEVLGLYERGMVDLYVHPSVVTAAGDEEGIPVSLMEAMAHGVATIATRTGAIGELVTDDVGVLVEPASATALACAIAELLRDPERRHRLGLAGRKRISMSFESTRNAQRMVELMGMYLRSQKRGGSPCV